MASGINIIFETCRGRSFHHHNGRISSLLQLADYKRTNNILFVYMFLDAPAQPECNGKVLLNFELGLDELAPLR
jgi:hypothetical protein